MTVPHSHLACTNFLFRGFFQTLFSTPVFIRFRFTICNWVRRHCCSCEFSFYFPLLSSSWIIRFFGSNVYAAQLREIDRVSEFSRCVCGWIWSTTSTQNERRQLPEIQEFRLHFAKLAGLPGVQLHLEKSFESSSSTMMRISLVSCRWVRSHEWPPSLKMNVSSVLSSWLALLHYTRLRCTCVHGTSLLNHMQNRKMWIYIKRSQHDCAYITIMSIRYRTNQPSTRNASSIVYASNSLQSRHKFKFLLLIRNKLRDCLAIAGSMLDACET